MFSPSRGYKKGDGGYLIFKWVCNSGAMSLLAMQMEAAVCFCVGKYLKNVIELEMYTLFKMKNPVDNWGNLKASTSIACHNHHMICPGDAWKSCFRLEKLYIDFLAFSFLQKQKKNKDKYLLHRTLNIIINFMNFMNLRSRFHLMRGKWKIQFSFHGRKSYMNALLPNFPELFSLDETAKTFFD